MSGRGDAGGRRPKGRLPRGKGRGGPPAGAAARGPSRSSSPPSPGREPATGATRRGTSSKPRGLGGEQVEGRQAVRELLLAGRRKVNEVLLASDLDPADVIDDIRELAAGDRVVVREINRSRLEAQARTDAPQGVLAFAAPLPEVDLDTLVRAEPGGPPPFLLALDGITDPGNLGALLRSASAAGVTGVVLPRHRAVHVTPTVAKAAAGAIEHIPMAVVGGLPAALARLRETGVWIAGLDAEAERAVWDLDLGDDAVALVLGAEGAGLSRLVRQRCDQLVSIPMTGPLASLNVATAGALACFEVARRRPR